MNKKFIISIILAAITLAIYWQVIHFEFVNFDDAEYVFENTHVISGLTADGIVWAFTKDYFANWHPLTWLFHMANCEMFGLNPGGHHLTNLILHIANTVLLFLLLTRMTNESWKSAFVAVLFAIHPLHVESVAWISELKDVLSGFMFMLTIMLYVNYISRPNISRYLITLSVFGIGLMSKPMLVTLPFVLLLLDYWPLGRYVKQTNDGEIMLPIYDKCSAAKQFISLNLFKEKIPFFALTLISCIITIYAQQSGGAIRTTETVPISFRLINALIAYINYIKKMFWPSELAFFYPLPQYLTILDGGIAAIILGGITFLVIRLSRKHPYAYLGWFWYLGTLVPVIGLIQAGGQSFADRYTYLPLIGLFIIIAWGVPSLFSGRKLNRVFSIGAAFVVIISLSVCTWFQLQHWNNSIALFKHALAVTSDNSIRNLLGRNLASQGRYYEAIQQYIESLRVKPDDDEVHKDLGDAYVNLGKLNDAVKEYTISLTLNPANAETHYELGRTYGIINKLILAENQFSEAVQIKPDFAEAHYNWGIALAKQGNLKEAADHFSRALQIDPKFVVAQQALSVVNRKIAGH